MNTEEIRKIAARALEILDRDGWNKGFVTMPDGMYEADYRHYQAGSHCLGGAWNLAAHGTPGWSEDWMPLAVAVHNTDPDYAPTVRGIAGWNNAAGTTEKDVRAVLAQLATVQVP